MSHIEQPIEASLALLKAAADPSRLRILRLVDQAGLGVGDLVEATGLSQPSVSRHLAALRASGVVVERHEGPSTLSSVLESLPEPLGDLMLALRSIYTGNEFGHASDLDRLAILLGRRSASRMERFDALASDWDALRARLLGGALAAGDICGLLVPDGGRWVDVGAGTGLLLPWLSGLAGEDGQVLAIEAAERMAAKARQRVRELNLANVRVLPGDMIALPVEDAWADGLILSLVLGQADDLEDVLEEALRVLVPGGRLVIADVVEHEHVELIDALGAGFRGFDPSELIRALEARGFRAIRRMPDPRPRDSTSKSNGDYPSLEPILIGATKPRR